MTFGSFDDFPIGSGERIAWEEVIKNHRGAFLVPEVFGAASEATGVVGLEYPVGGEVFTDHEGVSVMNSPRPHFPVGAMDQLRAEASVLLVKATLQHHARELEVRAEVEISAVTQDLLIVLPHGGTDRSDVSSFVDDVDQGRVNRDLRMLGMGCGNFLVKAGHDMVIAMQNVDKAPLAALDAGVEIRDSAFVLRLPEKCDAVARDSPDDFFGIVLGGRVVDDLDLHLIGTWILIQHASQGVFEICCAVEGGYHDRPKRACCGRGQPVDCGSRVGGIEVGMEIADDLFRLTHEVNSLGSLLRLTLRSS